MRITHTLLRHSLRWLPAAGIALGFVLLVAAVSGQQRQYVEAHVAVTAQTPLQFLVDEGLRAFEPLDQPDENYPTIMIDPDWLPLINTLPDGSTRPKPYGYCQITEIDNR